MCSFGIGTKLVLHNHIIFFNHTDFPFEVFSSLRNIYIIKNILKNICFRLFDIYSTILARIKLTFKNNFINNNEQIIHAKNISVSNYL